MSIPAFVLVAEDDDEMRRLVTGALRRDGYDVLAAADGASARAALASAHEASRAPDLLVCDVRMPGLSGLDLAAWIHTRGWPIRVILFSAFADETTLCAARQRGVACVLSKPFDLDDLRTVVRLLLGGAMPPL